MPEGVVDNDYVGTWLPAYTYRTSAPFSYAITQNHNGAFEISSSGLISILNASKINGKIVAQDTIIHLIITTTVGGHSESDTAYIYVKENSYCRYFDLDAATNGSGTRASPFNAMASSGYSIEYGFFFKRGTSELGRYNNFTGGHIGSSNHPTIFGAYGTGNKPKLIGISGGNAHCFILGGGSSITRCQYMYFFDLYVRNYDGSAFYVYRYSHDINFYNIQVSNCDKTDLESTISITTQSYADSAVSTPYEFINCRFDTTSTSCNSGCEKNFVKGGAGPITMSNCYFGKITGTLATGSYQLRLTNGQHSTIRYCYFEDLTAVAAYPWANVQLRQDYATFEECYFGLYGEGIFPTDPGGVNTEAYPDYLKVKQCYFNGHVMAGIYFYPSATSTNHSVGDTIEDCFFNNVVTAIHATDLYNAVIQRNYMEGDGTGPGVETVENAVGFNFSYNIIQGFLTNQISVSYGSGHTFYNNLVAGAINATGASSETARNNFYTTLTSVATESNNIDLDAITLTDYFISYGTNYHLKSSATSAINQGFNLSISSDYEGQSVGNPPEIGPYEFTDVTSSSDTLWVDAISGNDSYSGQDSNHPVKTLGQLEVILDNSISVVMISDTAYYESLNINIAKTYGDPLTIRSWNKYNQGNAKLKGLTTVTGWTQSGNYWSKVLSGMPKNPSYIYPALYYYAVTHLNGVNINGVYHRVSKYPDDTYTYLDVESGGSSTFTDTDELRANDYWNGAWICTLLNSAEWVNAKLSITDYNVGGVFTYGGLNDEETIFGGDETGLKYFIENHHNAANIDGEWTQNYSTNTLEVYYSGDLNAQTVQVPLVDSVLGITSSSYVTVRGIDFYGANKEQVKVYQSTGIVIDNCRFYSSPVAAIAFIDSDTVEATHNFVYAANDNGILGIVNDHSTFNDNYIKGSGEATFGGDRNGWHLMGIYTVYDRGDIEILRNVVDSVGYDGIGVAGEWTSSDVALNDIDIEIADNLVQHALMHVDDGGSIYVSGYDRPGQNCRIHNNLVQNMYQNKAFNQSNTAIDKGAIYLDRNSRYWTVDSNYLYDVVHGIFVNQSENGNVTVKNNEIISTRTSAAYRDYAFKCFSVSGGGRNDTVRFTNNVVVRGPDATGGMIAHFGWSTFLNLNNMVDSNKYFDPFHPTSQDVWLTIGGAPSYTMDFKTLAEIRTATAYEDHSTLNTTGWDFLDVSGITDDDFITALVNVSNNTHWFRLGSAVFRDLNGGVVADSVSVGPYAQKTLFYASGDLSTIDNRIYTNFSYGAAPPVTPPPTIDYTLVDSIGVNLTISPYLPVGWNNLTTITANATLALNYFGGSSSGATLTSEDAWFSRGTSGYYPGYFPDSVQRSNFITTGGTHDLIFSGLDPDHVYTITALGSRTSVGESPSRQMSFTIGSETQTIVTTDNATNRATFVRIRPSIAGVIILSCTMAVGDYGYVNGVVLREYVPPTAVPARRILNRVICIMYYHSLRATSIGFPYTFPITLE
jgi:hypothetical protein